MPSDTKNIHFRVPRPFYEEFKKNFPETGLQQILFTKFMELAIRGAERKDCFVESIYKEALEEAEEE